MPTGTDCATTIPHAEGLDRVGATDDAADLDVVIQERDELRPRVAPAAYESPSGVLWVLWALLKNGIFRLLFGFDA